MNTHKWTICEFHCEVSLNFNPRGEM